MSSPSGQAVLASAGSGKTTWIARQVAADRDRRIAVTTFTVLNAQRLRSRIVTAAGLMPPLTTVLPWFTFLLQEFVRPYQMAGGLGRILGLNFVEGRSAPYAKKAQRSYWVDGKGYVYSDKISELAISIDKLSGGAVLRRLRRLYAHIYIDEFQDLAGYDLDLIERMLSAGLTITMVGDPRQGTYSTNQSARNKKYRGVGVERKVQEWAARGLCSVVSQAHSYRCAPEICAIADLIYPAMPTTESRYNGYSQHRGAVIVRSCDVPRYLDAVRPQVLRHDKRASAFGAVPLNFGNAKGLEFDHVLIVPTKPIAQWLATGQPKYIAKSLAKLYVAITRACHSLAFVHDGPVRPELALAVWPDAGARAPASKQLCLLTAVNGSLKTS